MVFGGESAHCWLVLRDALPRAYLRLVAFQHYLRVLAHKGELCLEYGEPGRRLYFDMMCRLFGYRCLLYAFWLQCRLLLRHLRLRSGGRNVGR